MLGIRRHDGFCALVGYAPKMGRLHAVVDDELRGAADRRG
jgi:hypothetical protein